MYLVNSTKWDPARVAGQEQLLIDAWLEAVSDDSAPVWLPPLFSTRQLLRNLLAILPDVDRDVMRGYHVTDMVDEILYRLESATWIEECYKLDLALLKEKLREVRERIKDTTDDVQVRQHFGSLLRAFI